MKTAGCGGKRKPIRLLASCVWLGGVAMSVLGIVGCGSVSTIPVSVAISPTSATVGAGGTQQFTATVTNTNNTAVTWQVNGVPGGNATAGTISSAGLYTAPAVVPSPATVTVKAVSQAFPTRRSSDLFGSVSTIPVSVAISPTSATVGAGGTQQFTATVTNTNNTAVTWQVNGVPGGNATAG